MSRKRDAAQSEVEEKAKRAKIQEDGWAVQPPAAAQTSGRFQREQSSIYSALPGRRSFGGFNAIVEKYYANAVGLSAPGELASTAAETSEKDMTEHYESLVGLPRGPNQVITRRCCRSYMWCNIYIVWCTGSRPAPASQEQRNSQKIIKGSAPQLGG